jgi:hypothetical protein
MPPSYGFMLYIGIFYWQVVPKFKEAKITISLKAINERKMQNGKKITR